MSTLARTLSVLLAAALVSHAGGARAEPAGGAVLRTPAKELFGRVRAPARLEAAAIGFYTHGCLAGGTELPLTGTTWQVMRPSRRRNFGHPALVAFIEKLAAKAPSVGWNGLLVGDMAQARGGPMLGGHASHQVGLDADIWLTPMPTRELSRAERDKISATNMVARSRRDVDPAVWTSRHTALLRVAAEDDAVERIFVNPAIKRALCRETGAKGEWLRKVRPWWGHDYHFHVRLACPAGSAECKPQDRPPDGAGCGEELDYWFKDEVMHPRPPAVPSKPIPPLTLADLPSACRDVLAAP
jgi:penicillin-insensitive murein endopeptidase